MAKTTGLAIKTVFGKRKGGKSSKGKGPKVKNVSKYKGQGR
jgi:hypothetical protein